MIVRIVGEGPMDVGSDDYEGDIALILKTIWRRPFKSQSRLVRNLPKVHRRGRGALTAKFIFAANEAAAIEPRPDAVVFVIDARADVFASWRRDFARARAEVEPFMPVAIGLAVHEIEAWLLADPEARRAGMDDHCARLAYPSPEDDRDPKTTFKDWLGSAKGRAVDGAVDDVERRRLLIAAMRPDVVARLCPRGFAPFLDDVQRLRP